jgi:hypothetical protein
MKHSPVAKQTHQHARTFPLGHLRTQLNEQRFNVGPADIRRDRPGEDQFEGMLVLSLNWPNGSRKRYHNLKKGGTTSQREEHTYQGV